MVTSPRQPSESTCPPSSEQRITTSQDSPRCYFLNTTSTRTTMRTRKTTDSATSKTTHALSGSDRNRSKKDLGLAGGSFILICISLWHYSAIVREATIAHIELSLGPLRTISPVRQLRQPSFASLHSKPCRTRGQSALDPSFAFQDRRC